MNMYFNMEDPNQEIRLGTELLEMAFALSSDPLKLQAYNEILKMPGVDSALYMLYSATTEGDSHPRQLVQAAFMLGYYVYESLNEINNLWERGPVDAPS